MWTNTLLRLLAFFGTLKHGKTDAASLEPASKHKKIDYPKPDGVLTFDRLSSVFLSEHQPRGRPADPSARSRTWRCRRKSEHDVLPARRTATARRASMNGWTRMATPADPLAKDVRYVINAQNCVHCKTCDIKDPEPEHQLGAAAGRRRSGLRQHVRADGGCRSTSGRPTLNITYAYPMPPESISPALRARWNRFMVGVRRHEEMHGKIARRMVDEAYRSIRGLRIAGDPTCQKTKRELRRRTQAVYARYEARQEQFDRIEHRDGGKIDRLIMALVK
jgi:hypothetical protein